MIEKVAFFTFSSTISAIEHYRVYGPLTKAGVKVELGIKEGRVDLDVINKSDLILFQRDFASHFDFYKDVIRLARELRKPVIMDLDDDLLALPPNHPDRISTYYASGLPAFLHALLNVDGVTVSTEPLKEAVQKLNPNVRVLPNYFDDQLWNLYPPKTRLNDEPVTLFYMGTATHRPDLDSISKPLFQLADKFGSSIKFHFYGIEPPSGLEERTHVTHQPVQTFDYEKFSSYMSQIRVDIAIAPLLDNSFNRSKSAIKFFEYTAMGIPGVFADMPPYSAIITDGWNGLLAQTQQEWYGKIRFLIENPGLRQSMTQNAQASIKSHWLMNDHAADWLEAYNGIGHFVRKSVIDSNNILESLESIIIQQKEIRDKQELIKKLTDKSVTQAWQLSILEEQKATVDGEVFRLNQTLEETAEKFSILEEQKAAVDGEVFRLRLDLGTKNGELVSANSKIKLTQVVLQEKTKIIERARTAQQELVSRIDNLEHQLADKQRLIDELDSTISKIQLSTSWKITRPLRKLFREQKGG